MLSSFYRSVNYALDEVCPKSKVVKKSRSFKWYTEVHRELSERVNKAYILSRRTNRNEDHEAYKEELNIYKKRCRRDRNKSWNKFVECTKDVNEMAKLNRIIQEGERNNVNVFEKDDGSCTEPGKETLSYLINTHFPSSTDLIHIKYNSSDPHPLLDTVRGNYDKWINLPLLEEALGGFENKKSPGPDGLKPFIFEHLTDKLKDYLMIIYKCLSLIHI